MPITESVKETEPAPHLSSDSHNSNSTDTLFCEVQLLTSGRSFCGRPRFGKEAVCYWHFESGEKYAAEAVEAYFGPGITLRRAIEKEIEGGGSLEKAYLVKAPLGGTMVTPGCTLRSGNFFRANLEKAHLSYSDLQNTNFACANLEEAYLSDCDLRGAKFLAARLFNTKFRSNNFDGVTGLTKESFKGTRWGWYPVYRMLEEHPQQSVDVYRTLSLYFSQKGLLADASWAAYRSCVMRHRLLRQRLNPSTIWAQEYVKAALTEPSAAALFLQATLGVARGQWSLRLILMRIVTVLEWLRSLVLRTVIGYGEKPARVMWLGGLGILGYALIYQQTGAIHDRSFISCLYFSAVTFTTIGYGDLAPHGVFRLVAASEGLFGILLCGLFLFCLGRKSVGRA
ncbi:MAG: pentapeptide repeat-containing protein [Acidobacteria bacterium]|nr:pentapeptide repeat-containing protein [Acidobacteriota bacterium]